MLGAVAAATERIRIGTLVARASLRPPAGLRAAFETVARLAPGRLLAGIGAGDSAAREENDTFGVPAGTVADRVRELRDAVAAARDRGFPVWVGGNSSTVRTVAAAEADGWNQWGSTPTVFGRHVEALRRDAARSPFTCTWGGLVLLTEGGARAADAAGRAGADWRVIVGGPDQVAGRLADYVDAGADWVIAGAVAARDPRQAALLGEAVAPRLRAGARVH